MAKALTVEEIKSKCEKVELVYVSHYSKNKKTYIKGICKCGEYIDVRLSRIVDYEKQNKTCSCKKCGYVKSSKIQKGKQHSNETKQKIREKAKGRKTSDEVKQKMSEAHKGEKNHNYGKHCSDETKKKLSDARKGKCMGSNNPNYNPNLTDEEREQGRKIDGYAEWTKQVKENDNYTCNCCGQWGGTLRSHHLNCYKDFPNQRLDITNGVCLCSKCHSEFHSYMGGNSVRCTADDYYKWKQLKQEENSDTNSNVA